MDIRHLQYFLEVARHNSFTKAAESLYITQPTISKMVRNLEEELGVELFERLGKRVVLTDAGWVLYSQAEVMVKSFESMTIHIHEVMELKKGRIRIGLPPMVGANFFPRVIGKFCEQYPGIVLELLEVGSKKVEADVASGMLDSGVVLLPIDEDIFESYSFVKEDIKVVVHPTHALADRQEVSLAELAEERFLLFHEDFALHNRIIDACVRVGFHPKVIYKSSQWDFLSEMVAANIGITLLPQTICSELDPARFRILSLVNPEIKWHLGMIWRKNGYLSYATREWIRFTQGMLSK
ncbi:putative HTH-type transcriptional regulator YwbI [Brevibacillus reuszeri]|uniref:HTH-type transcriptional regulator YwbI n=1 Tax=Brevibacillus reuszeri TaxID=54915 RepID=A0A0K9YWX1_9BACL|nr:LysR family transcriptional regulator [Brevibacillus reuszeri]KNB73132.1 LysR family transcriptional regulator [Brevibacillus reuszeri]MED1856725.1 LysR family transcriptional regulator [Brevibacillus reuszeri]GED68528.1 putative HTH-type transcriptional regulator YwbI [Brevibacillus reuszeri]